MSMYLRINLQGSWREVVYGWLETIEYGLKRSPRGHHHFLVRWHSPPWRNAFQLGRWKLQR